MHWWLITGALVVVTGIPPNCASWVIATVKIIK